jgi:DNA-binding transcriptional regulator PaaX
VFDIPQKKNGLRVRLRRLLRAQGFGCLQNSVWISPDPLGGLAKALSFYGKDVESLITLEARPCSGESDRAIVNGAWDLDRVRLLHENCQRSLGKISTEQEESIEAAVRLREWMREERLAWHEAASLDPMLPKVLIPRHYLGREVWKQRNRVLKAADRRLMSLRRKMFRTEL